MEIAIPTVPLGIVALLGLLSPYATALVNQPWWSPTQKKIVAVVVALVLSAVALLLYYAITHDPVPAWPVLVLLCVVVAQAAYTLVLKASAKTLERATSLRSAIVEDSGPEPGN